MRSFITDGNTVSLSNSIETCMCLYDVHNTIILEFYGNVTCNRKYIQLGQRGVFHRSLQSKSGYTWVY